MAVREFPDRRAAGRRVFIAAAILFALIAVIGFARTYYLRAFFDVPPLPSMLVHLHGITMTLWLAMFGTQVFLISSRRVKVHQRLGFAGVGLAVVVIIIGIMTAIAAAARGGLSAAPPDIPPLTFMIVPFTDMVLFAALFGAAIYYRKRPANHKRLMLLTAINFLPPAIARIPIDAFAQAGPLAFFGIPAVIAIACLVVDSWKNQKLNKVFLAGTLLLIASYPLRLMIGFTEPWLAFAAWATS